MNPDRGGLDYVLDNPTAELLRGNVEITRAVIDSSPANMTHRFTSGIVNETENLSPSIVEQLLDELEVQFLGGRIRESMAWCAIRHSNKGKSEIHFVIALMDLLFRKPVNIYVDRIDRMRYSAWRDQFNLRHDLTLPSQHLRVEPPFDHLHKATEDVDFLRLVWFQVKKWVDDGDVKNRAELKVRLNASKYMVRWENNWGGPLEQPEIIGPKGRKLRLTGSIYYSPNFGLPAGIPLDLNDKKAVAKHLANLQKTIAERMDFRAYWTIGRLYGKCGQLRLVQGKANERLRKLNAEKLRSMRMGIAKRGLRLAHFDDFANLLQSGMKSVIPSRGSSQINTPAGTIGLVNPPEPDHPKDSADGTNQEILLQPEPPEPTPAKDDISAPAAMPAQNADQAPGTASASPANHSGNQSPKVSQNPMDDDNNPKI